jgi:hypothetical protein
MSDDQMAMEKAAFAGGFTAQWMNWSEDYHSLEMNHMLDDQGRSYLSQCIGKGPG